MCFRWHFSVSDTGHFAHGALEVALADVAAPAAVHLFEHVAEVLGLARLDLRDTKKYFGKKCEMSCPTKKMRRLLKT